MRALPLAAGLVLLSGPAWGAALPFSTSESAEFLLVGMGPENKFNGQPGVGQAVNVNNFELGANKAPVPSTSDFLDGGSSGGPALLGNVPNIPLNALVVFSGICSDGNIAVTNPQGVYNLQDVGVYGDLGILVARPVADADAGTSDSFFNDPNHFPNTFTSTGFTNPGVNNNTGGFGTDVNPKDAVQSTRIDDPNFAGVTGNVDFAALRSELANARTVIAALPTTGTLDVSGNDGVLDTHTTITLGPGLSVIDIVTGGGDFLLSNSNLVIDGPAGAMAIFRVPDHANFLVSNGNILAGDGGIGLNSVLFVSDREDNNAHFGFSNAVLNGVAFWTLALTGGEISVDNAQGCTQLIADKINLSSVRFCRCELASPAPACAGDLDGDGSTDTTDLNLVLSEFGCPSGCGPGDVDGDGDVDTTDLNIILSDFGCGG